MVKSRAFFAIVVLLLCVLPLVCADENSELDYSYSAQLGLIEASLEIPSNPILQAIGDDNYPVTPGDTYSLSYYDGKNLITLALQADGDTKVLIPSIGTIDASSMTYRAFKKYVENLISSYYSYSSPQLTLKGCGLFSVRVSGLVSYSQYITAWGLSRLSDLSYLVSPYASTRTVKVTYRDGSIKNYDLFNGLRNGNESDNPLLKPGCSVEFIGASSIISLSGAVKRPGLYQILDNQNLSDLINDYGCGLLSSADSQGIVITSNDGTSQTLTIEESSTYVPKDGDFIAISSSEKVLPFVTVTGAVSSTSSNTIAAANRFTYSFVPGESALQLVRNISEMLLPTSDISGIYILRDGQRLTVNASEALSSNEKGTLLLEQGDTVVIPFSQLSVTVTGAVKNPGTYAYVPDRNASYYINLAGGYTTTATKTIKVLDKDGKKMDSSSYIPSDCTIVANNNNLTTNLALASSVLAIVGTVLTIIINTHTISTF